MTRKEAAKLLELMELAYPLVYKNMDDLHRRATVRMWENSFPRVPYPIVESCFNTYRMENRYPPTVADLNKELRRFHLQAARAADIHRMLGNPEYEARFRRLMDASAAAPPGWPGIPEALQELMYLPDDTPLP